jgi:hypothetical protein
MKIILSPGFYLPFGYSQNDYPEPAKTPTRLFYFIVITIILRL